MRRQSTKEQRYIARQKFAEITESTKEIRGKYNAFYEIVVKNRENTLDEIIEVLNNRLNMNFDKAMFIKFIKQIKNEISATKGEELIVIYNYINAKANNDNNRLLLYTAKLTLIDRKKEENRQKTLKSIETRNNGIIAKQERHSELIDEVNEMFDNVLNDTKEVSRDEVITRMQFIKRYLKELDYDKYLNFLFKYNNLNSISKEEIEQLNEVIDYFITNLINNLLTLKKINTKNEEEVLNASKLPVDGEDSVDDSIKNKPGRLLKWKISKIEGKLAFYERYKEMLIKLHDTDDLNAVKKILPNDKKQMLGQYDFIVDFYENLKKANDVYNVNIKNVLTIPQNDYEELNSNFKKRLLK